VFRSVGLPLITVPDNIIILITWAMWKERNEWFFQGTYPSVQTWYSQFKDPFYLLHIIVREKM
jgi:hypothetical protein